MEAMNSNGKMGKRMLHGNICVSKKIDKLSAEAERLYTRLLTQVDDLGNYPADPESIRKVCFPLKRRWNNWSIQIWLNKIVGVGLASYYESGRERYVHFERFADFQKLQYTNERYPRHPDDRGGHPPMTGVVIDDDRGGHEGMTGMVTGDEGGGQMTEPALISTDAIPKFLSKKEVSRSEPSPPVSNKEKHPVHSGSNSSASLGSLSSVPQSAPVGSKKLREWDEDIEGTPAALIRRAINYHFDWNPRDYHRKQMSVGYVRKFFRVLIDEVPEAWEPQKPKTRNQFDPRCPKCKGKGGSMKKGQGVGRVWQNCDCGKGGTLAAA
jgi:hypothetical protein